MNHPLKFGQPRFLSSEEVLTLHATAIAMYGGAHGVLGDGKLDASLAVARQGFDGQYAHEFPFGMAAAYGFHLAMNHPFRDGNKRAAFAAMVAFLHMNGWSFEIRDEDAAQIMIDLIEQRHDKPWLAGILEGASRPRQG